MKIIISPAKTMVDSVEENPFSEHPMDVPFFQKEAELLITTLKGFGTDDLKALFKASDAIAEKTEMQIKHFGSATPLPALFAYRGAVFKALGPEAFTPQEMVFAKEHLVILSALYGALKPFDAIVPHRLDMNTKLLHGANKNLRSFWEVPVTDWFKSLLTGDEPIINLASREYDRLFVKSPLKEKLITLEFYEIKGDAFKTVAVYSKQARGLFLREIIRAGIEDPLEIKKFKIAGYAFNGEQSSRNRWVFAR